MNRSVDQLAQAIEQIVQGACTQSEGCRVYDVRGGLLVEEGSTLTPSMVALLPASSATEILVRDARVADIPVAQLYPAHVEAKASEGIYKLLSNPNIARVGMEPLDLITLRPAITDMVQSLFPMVFGDPNLTGSAIRGYDTVHPVKVAGLSILIGRAAGLDKTGLLKLGMAALLMNVGYLRMRGQFLDRKDQLTQAERVELEQHPTHSRRIIEASGQDEDVLQAVEQHHERWDGKGYPNGLSRGDISPFAQIISIADTYYALLSERPYRPAFKPHEAAEFILASSGEMFDPELVQFFARRVPHYSVGTSVLLSSGELGIVTNAGNGQVARPVVRVCYENGQTVEPYDLDLSLRECMAKLIVEIVT